MQKFLIRLIKIYKLALSPWFGQCCRFYPSCADYAMQAVATHGAARGGWLTLRRLARCQPWSAGFEDPVPAASGATAAPASKNV